MINYYELLEIPPTSSWAEVIGAGKKRLNELRALGDVGQELPTAKIELIEIAVETLGTAESRVAYDAELTESIALREKREEETIDFSQYLLESSDNWESLVPPELTDPTEIISYLFDLIIELPNNEIAKPLMMSFLLLPSAIASCVPIVQTWGKSGVGKSQPCKFGAALWGNQLVLGSATYAGIRNQLQKDRWQEPVSSRGEKNYILAWDDIKQDKLQGDLYTLIRGGYSRSSSFITMAGKDGENISFDIFGKRIFSSITPFFSITELSELKRRMLVFPMASAKRAICDFDEINWKGLNRLTANIWSGKSNLDSFVKHKKAVRSYFKNSGDKTLSVDRQNLFTDLLATGLCLGIFTDLPHAIRAINQHEETMNTISDKEQDGLNQILFLYIEAEELEASKTLSKTRIKPDKLKELINQKVRGGELDGFPRRGEIPAAMRQLGYALNIDLGAWERAEQR